MEGNWTGSPGPASEPGRRERERPTAQQVWEEFERGIAYKTQLDLYETVKRNEDFFVGKQWEGVQANGLPTPVFNFIKRIVLYLVSSTATDNLKISASPLGPMGVAGLPAGMTGEELCRVVNRQFESLFEQNKMGKLIRDFMRNAAVDGDACLYSWFDPKAETGQRAKGAIRTELLENTRVIFGNPNSPEPQSQPYILVMRRELLGEARREAEDNGCDPDLLRPDTDEAGSRFDAMSDSNVTTVTRLWKDRESGTVWCMKTGRSGVIRESWDTGLRRYPVVWMNWDRVPGNYHGQAAVTGLIPNQIFVNKMFAMTMISLMTTAYPKIVYDRTRVAKWSSAVGQAIPVNGGDVNTVARCIDPPAISPQVGQFIQLAIELTKEFMGATDAALGQVRPDNTSAIIALQKASSVPLELVKQNLFQAVEDLGSIWMDMMGCCYGRRYVERKEIGTAAQESGEGQRAELFDFSVMERVPLSLKLDVGGSAYWSEIAQINTLDHLLTQGKITVIDYLERVPNGYISNQQELIETLKARESGAEGQQGQQGQQPAGQAGLMGLPGGFAI